MYTHLQPLETIGVMKLLMILFRYKGMSCLLFFLINERNYGKQSSSTHVVVNQFAELVQ